ncbi:Uma2 family endonuclease [Spirulina sp. 06S082]|uniref:Uma2 family endonuclease n=1 Tax=Spirulina sp. 06S082 TaxID=3110248 RepID=UPI002B20A6C8|nr:Uma2 family endonuclease [Spirulina sp. 06S082]MEA5470181.1 Uma2 family endonuclease [Spirulina sp. 06S082]
MTPTKQRADRVLIHNFSWQQFENLLLDLGDSRSSRIAYDTGTLEIMTPLPEHEYFKQSISIAIEDIAEVLEYDYESYGSTTWRREVKQAGLEPDNCFYFQNEALIRGKVQFDLNRDPPPDLALEIDLTSKSLNRFPIYARLGVPELWCYEDGTLKIYCLQEESYLEVEQSGVFPTLNIRALPQIIQSYRLQGRRALRRAVRAWVREQV